MYKSLNTGVIGVSVANLDEGLKAAQFGGFEGLEVDPSEIQSLVGEHGAAYVTDKFAAAGIRPSAWVLPHGWRGTEAEAVETLAKFPATAKALAAIGATRLFIWIGPGSNDLPYEQNFKYHAERLKPMAKILADHGCSLGLEYIGPYTSRSGAKYEFVHDMKGMLELAAAAGPNVGLMLDSWHWYTAGEGTAELAALRPDQVVHCHVNDAPAGIDRDAQIDSRREVPGATGVIDIGGFLRTLNKIGYEGPVTPEPFRKELNDLPSDEERLQVIGDAMRKIWAKAGM